MVIGGSVMYTVLISSQEPLPVDETLGFLLQLKKGGALAAEKYLEYVVFQQKLNDEKYHTKLANYYLEAILPLLPEEYGAKVSLPLMLSERTGVSRGCHLSASSKAGRTRWCAVVVFFCWCLNDIRVGEATRARYGAWSAGCVAARADQAAGILADVQRGPNPVEDSGHRLVRRARLVLHPTAAVRRGAQRHLHAP